MRAETIHCRERFFAASGLAIIIISLAACGGDGDSFQAECQFKEDCPPGETCKFGHCVPIEAGTDTLDRSEIDTFTETTTVLDTDTVGESDEETETRDECLDPKTDCPDDANACTAPTCDSGKCAVRILDGEACTSDNDPCTDEICVQDTCTTVPLDSVPCEFDDNECTNDICLDGVCSPITLDETPCNYDNNPCTEDICANGVCSAIPRSGTACEVDDNECTNDVCESGLCVAHPLTGPTCKDDGNECTRHACDDGVCKTTQLTGNPCTLDANECTRDRCVDGVCTARNLSQTSCGPLGNACMEDVCIQGTCGNPREGHYCSADNNVCTSDVCNGAGVCESTSLGVGAPCDDGLKCTGYLVCDELGTCGPSGGIVPCPAEACQETTCIEPTGGEYPTCDRTALTGTSCDNGVFCDGEETCNDGICQASLAACSDLTDSSCQAVVCDEASLCQVVNHEDDESCADEALCNGNEVCMDGVCSAGVPACETGNECVTQDCVDMGDSVLCEDSVIEPDGTVCFANNVCYGTGTQRCLDGTCTHGEYPVCEPADNDGSFCSKYYQCVPETEGPDCKYLETQDIPLVENTLSCELPEDGAKENSSHPFSTSFTNNEVAHYLGCGEHFTGGEAGYLISLSPNAPFTVQLTTTGSTIPEENLYLLHVTDPCNTSETNCAAFGQGRVSSTTNEDGKAFIVIDGLNGNRGEGTISLECPQ